MYFYAAASTASTGAIRMCSAGAEVHVLRGLQPDHPLHRAAAGAATVRTRTQPACEGRALRL